MTEIISPKHILKNYFGYDAFRPQQEDVINKVLSKNDALVLMPTGGGKSICFQVPALIVDGLTIVISPLIALMKDQVEALRGNGVKASFLNSSISVAEQDAVLWAAKMGELKLLYIAPEKLFQGSLVSFFKEINVSLFAIDESHCISSWGHDFRPEYRQLNIIKDEFPEVPILALTATADNVTRRDICKQLGIAEENIFVSSFDRPNLNLEVAPGRKKLEQIKRFLEKRPNQAGIIYCLSRKSTEELAEDLKKAGYLAEAYHAGMPNDKRSKTQVAFLNDQIQIVVATIAFGMGIDKSNVRWVIHNNLPSNVESFYQEIGRAGRDGMPADTLLFYSYADIITRISMIDNGESSEEHKEMLRAKLDRMKQYAEANICRRRILISYFNENFDKNCGNCDVCRNPRNQFDATVLAQKVLSAISRTYEKIALSMLVDILRGSRNQAVLRAGYDKLPTFGVGHDLKGEVWIDYILQLLNYGAMDIAYDENHYFKLNKLSWQILKGQRKVEISEYVSYAEKQAQELELKPVSKTKIIKTELFEKLRVLRKQIADSLGTPPYIIFSDATLHELADKQPINDTQFLEISGVGQEKLRRYGDVFIKEIKQHNIQNRPTGKGQTQDLSLQLFKEGIGVEEIASMRSLSTATIIGHLIKAQEKGESIDLEKLIDPWELNAIKDVIIKNKIDVNGPMKPVLEIMGEATNYGAISIAFAILRQER